MNKIKNPPPRSELKAKLEISAPILMLQLLRQLRKAGGSINTIELMKKFISQLKKTNFFFFPLSRFKK